MSRDPKSGTHVCDRCAQGCGNGGVMECLVVSDLDPETGHVRNLHFCRDHEDKDGNKVKGCDSKVLSARNMQHYREVHGGGAQ